MEKEQARPKIWLFAFIFFMVMFSIAIFYDYPAPDEYSTETDAGVEKVVEEEATNAEEVKSLYDGTEDGIDQNIGVDFCVEGEMGKIEKTKNFLGNLWKARKKKKGFRKFWKSIREKDVEKLFASSQTLQCRAAHANLTKKAVAAGRLSEVYEWDQLTPEDARHGEIAVAYRLLAIQTGPAQNPTNKPILKKVGVKMNWFKRTWPLNAMYYFPQGIGNLESFIAISVKKFKIASNDLDTQIKHIVAIISRCAIGKYQIMPVYHFKHLDGMLHNWDKTLPENWTGSDSRGKLRILHAYLRTESMQDYTNFQLLNQLGQDYEWYIPAMSTAYYAGDGAGKGMLNLKDTIESGGKMPKWTTKTQRDGFGSIYYYSMKSYSSYQKMTGKKTIDTAEDLKIFQISIAKKETEFLHMLRVKPGAVLQIEGWVPYYDNPETNRRIIVTPKLEMKPMTPVVSTTPDLQPMKEVKPEKKKPNSPTKATGNSVCKDGKICITTNGKEMCITPTVPCK